MTLGQKPPQHEETDMTGQVLSRQFSLSLHVTQVNLEGISHAASLESPAQGNCINWILGHIVVSRGDLHRLLGLSPVWSGGEAAVYERGASALSEASKACRLESLLTDLRTSQEMVAGALGKLTDGELAKPRGADETLADQLALLSFHESYHAGQLGLLRRIAGKQGAIP